MKNQKAMNRFYLVALCLCLLLADPTDIAFGQNSWHEPIELPKDASSQEIAKIQSFNEQIRLAKEATDRNSKVELMNKALSYRPNHPDNIRIEFEMAVALSQHWDPENPQPLRRNEALKIYERILNTYNHEDYYSPEPVNSTSCKQFMVPRSAVHLACLQRGLNNDSEAARETLYFAMGCMQKTYERRKNDWIKAPAPAEPKLDDPFGGPWERAKWEGRMDFWRNRKTAAKSGEVFSPLEMAIAEAAVRQYGYSFGPRLKLVDVVYAMGNVMQDFPDTPMAKIASKYIERAKEKVLRDLDNEIIKESIDNLESNSLLTKSDSTVSVKDLAVTELLIPKGKELFIPKAGIALILERGFVLDFASGKLLNPAAKVDSEQAHKNLLKLVKGDIAWDGSLLSVRKAKALTVRQESHRPLKCILGRWCNSDRLPDKVDLPYSLLVVTNEDMDYLISILEIKHAGIKIKYKKLTAEEAKSYYPIEKNGK